jgi:photosystem II biogenesis protein Psp29
MKRVAHQSFAVNNVRTVSDTKRVFYTTHTRPINSIYRRVVEELMVEMHLLLVNGDFHYDPVFGLGVFTSFHQFMQGYRPEQDIASIFNSICIALQDDPQRYRHDAERLEAMAKRFSADELIAGLSQSGSLSGAEELQQSLQSIASNSKFKYSRLFTIGLFALLEATDSELIKDETKRVEALKKICAGLNIPEDKLQKDLDLYRSNLEKITQVRIVMEDALQADRKKREDREKAKTAASSSPDATESTGDSATGS